MDMTRDEQILLAKSTQEFLSNTRPRDLNIKSEKTLLRGREMIY